MRRSLRSWLWRVPLEQEVDEELAFHLEMRTREYVQRGFDPETARDMAVKHAGDLRQLKRQCVAIGRKRDREMRVTLRIEELGHDIRCALRQLRRAPAFTCVAALTLAIGIGGNSAMFALADATLLRPLPFPAADRLVILWGRSPNLARGPVSLLDQQDWRERASSFDGMAAIGLGLGGGPLLAAPDGTLESVDRQSVTSSFFDVLGVRAIAGRTFLPSDDGPAASSLIIRETLWRGRFASDPSIIGSEVRLNGQPHTVVGVVPDTVRFSRAADVWTLIRPMAASQRGVRFVAGVARLKPDVTIEAAQADLARIADQLAREHPPTNKDQGVSIEPLHAGLMGELRLTSLLLLGVVAFVLVMCCANVTNLLLARATTRARELAMRSALGAGRRRIVRQLLTESLVLAALGGSLGVGIGVLILRVAPSVIPAGVLPAAISLTPDVRVLLFCLVATVLVGVVFGVLPAWQATRTSLVEAITSDSRSTTRGGGRLRSLLASAQVASAVLLLCGAGLLLRTLWVLNDFDAGYRAAGDSVVTLDFSVPRAGHPTAQSLLQFYEAVERDVRALPNVARIGWSSTLPWGNDELGRSRFEIVGEPAIDDSTRPSATLTVATSGYFETLGLPILAGRGFTAFDTLEAAPVCIVDEAFVRRHLGGRDPVGVRVDIRSAFLGKASVRTIVGVTRHYKERPDVPEERPHVYVPLTQAPYDDVYLVAEATQGRPEALVPGIRAIVAR
jgi:predicted permease